MLEIDIDRAKAPGGGDHGDVRRAHLVDPHSQQQLACCELALCLVVPNAVRHGSTTPSADSAEPALSRRAPRATAARARRQVDTEPDRSQSQPGPVFELVKTASAVESDRAPIGSTDRKVCAARAHFPYGREPLLH